MYNIDDLMKDAPQQTRLDPLDQDDIDIALQEIEDDYPLARKPLYEVLPIFALCCGRRSHEREKLLTKNTDDVKMEQEIKETDERLDKIIKDSNGYRYQGSSYLDSEMYNLNPADEEEGQDIFDIYGFGVTSWFSLLKLLIKIYFVFSLVGIGLMYFYSQNGSELDQPGISKIAKFTLGNLGYSRSNCDMMFLDLRGKHSVQCNKGSIQPLVSRGIIPEDLPAHLPNDYCGDPSKFNEIDKCSKVVSNGLEDAFNTNCVGKATCDIDFNAYLNLGEKSNPSCVADHAKFYIQYKCKMNDEEVRDMRKIGVVIAVVFLILAAFFNLMM